MMEYVLCYFVVGVIMAWALDSVDGDFSIGMVVGVVLFWLPLTFIWGAMMRRQRSDDGNGQQ